MNHQQVKREAVENDDILSALVAALRSDGAVRLVTRGRRGGEAGLFPAKARKSIEASIGGESPLLKVVREERQGKKSDRFVEVTRRGMEYVASSLPVDQLLMLRNEIADRYRVQTFEVVSQEVPKRFQKLESERKRIVEARDHLVSETREMIRAYSKALRDEQRNIGTQLSELQKGSQSSGRTLLRRCLQNQLFASNLASTDGDTPGIWLENGR